MILNHRTISLVMIVLALCAASNPATAQETNADLRTDGRYAWPRENEIVLDGTWSLAFTDVTTGTTLPENLDALEWFDATLPAEAHWALYRAGKGPHPYVGQNAKDLRWVEAKSWWYRKRFQVPAEFKAAQIRLSAEGTDYYGHYWLNGKYLGRSEGTFGNMKTVVDNLRFGEENEIVVRVECGGYKVGKEGGAPKASLVKSELWSGWEIGSPDLNTVGLWQPLRLIPNNWPSLERPFVHTLSLGDNTAHIRVTVETHTIREAEAPCSIVVTVSGEDGGGQLTSQPTLLTPESGLNLVDIDMEITNPRLWWPVGMGEQPMYRAEILLQRDGAVLDRLTVPFGIRTIERKAVSPVRHAYEDEGWVFHVNGRPFFAKGTNWMPIDALADTRPEQYEWLLSMARDAGIQMIRVWGGGIIEPDIFYELCDRYGILVWQDFPLTCGWKAAAINRTLWKNTIQWAVYRLRNHPSLAFWCGGNEFSPDHEANADLVGACRRFTRILDGTRPFMAASPDEGDIHGYEQWDASWAWDSSLIKAPFASEWGSHGMPSYQTYTEIVRKEELDVPIGPSLLKMDQKLMTEQFPEITYHWVEFQADRLPQMLSRGSAFDNLGTIGLERFTEAIAAGASEFYKVSAEAARSAFPTSGGLLFWVWKRPWPVVAIQIVDGFGQPSHIYYDVKRAYSSPWPCLKAPHLNYVAGETVKAPAYVLTEGRLEEGMRLTARLLGPDLTTRREWREFPGLTVAPETASTLSEAVAGPELEFQVPDDAGGSFFFVIVELSDAQGALRNRNVYTFRCPPQLEDAEFRTKYRAKPQPGLMLTEGPWMRPQVEQFATQLETKILKTEQESAERARFQVEVRNTGERPAVMTRIHVPGPLRYVAEDAYFWLEPGESRTVNLRIRIPEGSSGQVFTAIGQAWNTADSMAGK